MRKGYEFCNRILSGAALVRAIRMLSRVSQWVAGGIMVILMLLVTCNVFSRFLLGKPMRGTVEISEFMLVFIVFLSLALTQFLGGHVRVELVCGHFSGRKQSALRVIGCFIGISFWALIANASVARAVTQWGMGTTSDVLHIPVFPFILIVPTGCFLIILELLVELSEHLRSLREGV